MNCDHKGQEAWTDGLLCLDCGKFFHISSAYYRSTQYLQDLWMALHNLNAERYQTKLAHYKGPVLEPYPEVTAMRDKIDIGVKHANYEEIISEAEAVLAKYNYPVESVFVPLCE